MTFVEKIKSGNRRQPSSVVLFSLSRMSFKLSSRYLLRWRSWIRHMILVMEIRICCICDRWFICILVRLTMVYRIL